MPSHELVDIVDRDGSYQGHTTRKAAIENRLRYQSVHLVAFHHGQIVLQRRALEPIVSYLPGWYASFASGVVRHRESLEEAVVRETEEEIGRLYDYRYIGAFPFNDTTDEGQPVYVGVFTTELDSIPEPQAESVTGFKVFSPEEILLGGEARQIMPETVRAVEFVLLHATGA